MKIIAVILGVLGCVILSAFGQADVWVGEMRLQLASPLAPEGVKPVDVDIGQPVVVMRLLDDGSVRSRFVLCHVFEAGDELEEDVALALADGLIKVLKTGERQSFGPGMSISSMPGKMLLLRRRDGKASYVPKEVGDQVATMIRNMRERAKAFIGADLGLRRDAISKLKGPVVERCSITMVLGSVDLPELGGLQVVSCKGLIHRGTKPRFRFRVEPQDRGSPGPDPSIGHDLLEELGSIPDRLARGKTVRWESNVELLRAFPENKAIYYRPDTRKGEDLRISMETAQEAWKMLEKRDRLMKWLEREVIPGVEALAVKK